PPSDRAGTAYSFRSIYHAWVCQTRIEIVTTLSIPVHLTKPGTFRRIKVCPQLLTARCDAEDEENDPLCIPPSNYRGGSHLCAAGRPHFDDRAVQHLLPAFLCVLQQLKCGGCHRDRH